MVIACELTFETVNVASVADTANVVCSTPAISSETSLEVPIKPVPSTLMVHSNEDESKMVEMAVTYGKLSV